MKNKRIASFVLLVFLSIVVLAQVPRKEHSGSVYQKLKKLAVLGSVLYVAAHPDDENTQLITYWANEDLLRTGYLSATRGSGGQNLIGTEIGEALGVLRTQELLAARGIDGGVQFFSSAKDFGFSKNPSETFSKWEKEKVLADFVWVIRSFRPDVIVTRFNTTPGVTHGHHTASAILAREAFTLAGKPEAYPEQLKYVEVWQPKKLFWNTSWWFFQRSGAQFDTTGLKKVDVGIYNPLLGKSYTEIAAESRSMHKSQGFGRAGTRGTEIEYLQQWEGEDTEQIFEGIDLGWSRVKNAEQVEYYVKQAISSFDPAAPWAIVGDLIMARKELLRLPDQYWKDVKLKEIDELILDASGTFIEVVAKKSLYSPGDSIHVDLELINRSPVNLSLASVSFSDWDDRNIYTMPLIENHSTILSFEWMLSKDAPVTNPYWLTTEGTEGTYHVTDYALMGAAENEPPVKAAVTLKIDDQFIRYEFPVVFKEGDPVKGEIYKPLHIAPSLLVALTGEPLVFGSGESKMLVVGIRSLNGKQEGDLVVEAPPGWKTSSERIPFTVEKEGVEKFYSIMIYPPGEPSEAIITVQAQTENKLFERGMIEVAYDHIPVQRIFPKSQVKAVKLDLKIAGDRIGYIMGAGDDLPSSLAQIGCQVDLLNEEDVERQNLARYDAIILGVRAFNTIEWLSYKNEILFEYVKEGGNVIVQYNTSHQLVTEKVAPYDLHLSRNRVTVEQAEMKFLVPEHAVLTTPNEITQDDFEGWVQERGLYFPDKWSKEFIPIFQTQDPDEDPSEGSLLIARYGKGYYVYTGLSFFRELPAGVPGAYRLLANMISLGKEKKQ